MTTDAEVSATVPDRPRRIGSKRAPSSHNNVIENRSPTVSKVTMTSNETSIKHQNELYWLRLELDTTRKAKEAVEDRMAELYRDMQGLEEDGRFKPSKHPLLLEKQYVTGLQKQVDKYERMLKVMNNQIHLVRTSSDNIVKTMKDKMTDLMDEKNRIEVDLTNKNSKIESEKKELEMRLKIAEQAGGMSNVQSTRKTHQQDGDNKNGWSDAIVEQFRDEMQRLSIANEVLTKELGESADKLQENEAQWTQRETDLNSQIEVLQNELLVLRSSAEASQRLDKLRKYRDETVVLLDRVSLLWDQADGSIQNLESLMMELRPQSTELNQDPERVLSTLETASLVHGQVKVSLMLVELKLRNSLSCLKQDQSELGGMGHSHTMIESKLTAIHDEAMTAIHQVEQTLDQQIRMLGSQSEAEAKVVKETLEYKVEGLREMQNRQTRLEETISWLQTERPQGNITTKAMESSEMYVSREVLEQLQNEVLEIVERVKEKNEVIGRLNATLEEHKVRERALTEELRRHIREQSERQLAEQRRIAEEWEDASDETDDEYDPDDDDSTAYEEKSVDVREHGMTRRVDARDHSTAADEVIEYDEKSVDDNEIPDEETIIEYVE